MERTVVRCVWVILLGWSASVLGGGYATVSRNYTVDAIQRTTLHSYPDGGSAQPLPLLLVLHGDGGNAAGIRAALPLEAQANGAAAFSYLSAQGGTFEYWTDAGRGHEGRFVQAIIANYGVAGITIDPARVYLVGFSGGGTMAQALGCRLGAGVVRKLGIHSGSLYPVDNDFTYTGNGGVSCNLPGTMLIWGKPFATTISRPRTVPPPRATRRQRLAWPTTNARGRSNGVRSTVWPMRCGHRRHRHSGATSRKTAWRLQRHRCSLMVSRAAAHHPFHRAG